MYEFTTVTTTKVTTTMRPVRPRTNTVPTGAFQYAVQPVMHSGYVMYPQANLAYHALPPAMHPAMIGAAPGANFGFAPNQFIPHANGMDVATDDIAAVLAQAAHREAQRTEDAIDDIAAVMAGAARRQDLLDELDADAIEGATDDIAAVMADAKDRENRQVDASADDIASVLNDAVNRTRSMRLQTDQLESPVQEVDPFTTSEFR